MRGRPANAVFLALIALFFGAFMLYPLAGVFTRTFFANGHFTAGIFWATVSGPIVTTTLVQSLLLGIAAVLLTSIIALPLAVFVSRYDFPLKKLASGLVLVPMIMPPFVGAIGIRRIFARYGLLNMAMGTAPFDWFQATGFWGVAFLQALHLFPIMYMNVTAALANVDPQLEEAARSSGASPWRTLRDVTLRLAMPGFVSGAIIVFLWSITDLGTPLVLGYRQVLAVEIFDRVTSINNDPTGPALVVLLTLITVGFIFLFKRFLKDDGLSAGVKGSRARQYQRPSRALTLGIYAYLGVVLLLALLPHIGLALTSIAGQWFMTALPDRYTLRFFSAALADQNVAISVRNSVLYSSVSTVVDIVLGVVIAYFILRRKIRAGWLVDAMVMLPLALPGLILAFGYVATFSGTILDPLKNPVPLLIIGYAVRRLPFCFRAAYAGLQQCGVQFEEAARVSGASSVKTLTSVTVPLIGANIVAGGILAFMFAALEVSESMVLAVKEEFFPVTREIYALLGKIPDGDFVAAALGVLCMLFLAAGLVAASALMGKQMGKMFRM